MRFNIASPQFTSRPTVKIAVKPTLSVVQKGVVKGQQVKGESYPYPPEAWPTVDTYDVSVALDGAELAGTSSAEWSQPATVGMTIKLLMAPAQAGTDIPDISTFVEMLSFSADALTFDDSPVEEYESEFGLPEADEYIPYAIKFIDSYGRQYVAVTDTVQVVAA